MVKWKAKKEPSTNFRRFHYASGGLVLKLKKNNRKKVVNLSHVWDLNFSCYTNGKEIPLAHKEIKVHMAPDARYYKNLKGRAARVARRLLDNHVARITKFSEKVNA